MTRNKSLVLLLLLGLLLTHLNGTSLPAIAQALSVADETALRQMVDRYFDAHERGSVTDYSALWSDSSPDREAKTQALERILSTTRLMYSPTNISKKRLQGDRAVLWVTTRRTSTREGGSVTVTPVALSMEFVREQSGWRLWREASAVAELASALVAASDDNERQALLSIDPSLRNRDLLVLLWGQADRYYQSNDYPRTLGMLRVMLQIAEAIDSTPDQALVWRQLAGLSYRAKKFAEAVNAYQKAISLIGDERKSDLASLWTGLALSHIGQKNRPLAIESFQKSLAISRSLNDNVSVAGTLDSIAALKREGGDYAEAMSGYHEALAIRETMKDRAAIASSLVNIAEVEYDQGEDDRALERYQSALSQLRNISRPELQIHVLHNVASLYYLQGNYDLALTHYQREREISDSISNLPGAAAALAGIGLIQTLYGEYAGAVDSYSLCLAIWRQIGGSEEEANTLQKLGRVLTAQGEYQKAVTQFRTALSLREKVGNPREIGWASLDLGSGLAVLREFEEALSVERQALALFESLADKSGMGASLIHLAGIHFVREDYKTTIELAGRAAGIARDAGDAEIFWQAKHRQGRGYYRLKQYLPAREAFLESIASIENPKGGSAENRPQRLLDDKIAPYLGMVDLTIDQNLPTEAFRFAERAKSRNLKMLLGSNRLRITREMTTLEVTNEQKLQKEKATLLSQYNREREHGPQSPRLAELTLKLQKVDREYQGFEKNLYRLHPKLKLLRGEGEAVGAERLRVLLPSRNSAILEFVETDESLYLLAFSSGRTGVPRLEAYPLGLTRREAAERAVALQDLIVRRQSGWEPLARELYDRLLKPAETQLKGKTNLVIVPDGWLWNLPFAALQPVDGAFLIDAYSISLCSSVTAMNLMGLTKGRPIVRTQLLAFGHPELTTAAKERMKVASRDEKFVAEEQTSAEVQRISELYGTAGSRTIGGADARSDRLRDEASRATRLHLAAPAVVNEASPLYSQIALAASPAIAGDAGVLQLRELLSWKMDMDLAVFSSSQIVPRGQSIGRGISGLSWTLLAAGTPTVLIGQWKVEGKTEGDVMLAFHRELRLSRQKALSWQRAAKEAIRNPDRRHPFNWAGYMLVGDGH